MNRPVFLRMTGTDMRMFATVMIYARMRPVQANGEVASDRQVDLAMSEAMREADRLMTMVAESELPRAVEELDDEWGEFDIPF